MKKKIYNNYKYMNHFLIAYLSKVDFILITKHTYPIFSFFKVFCIRNQVTEA